MQFGTIDDCASVWCITHLLKRERAADHVAGESLAAFGIEGFAADAVVHGEAGMAPVLHALGKVGAEHAFGGQEIQHLVAQRCSMTSDFQSNWPRLRD